MNKEAADQKNSCSKEFFYFFCREQKHNVPNGNRRRLDEQIQLWYSDKTQSCNVYSQGEGFFSTILFSFFPFFFLAYNSLSIVLATEIINVFEIVLSKEKELLLFLLLFLRN